MHVFECMLRISTGRPGKFLLHVAEQIEPAAPGHREIEDRHVPIDPARELERLVTVGRFAHDRRRWIVRQHLLEPVSHDRVVVRYEDSHKCVFCPIRVGRSESASLCGKV
jgi:hypothetical protein